MPISYPRLVHGIFRMTKLPATVAFLDDISAQATLPIACGKSGPAVHTHSPLT
jgi:hypothetical protein